MRAAALNACGAALACALVLTVTPAPAETPAPRAKPAADSVAGPKKTPAKAPREVKGDRSAYHEMLAAAKRGDWSKAKSYARKSGDPVAETFADWLYLTDPGSQPPFDPLNDFLESHPDWPARNFLFGKAEQALPPAMSGPAVLAWFGTREPVTGEGMIRLGDALIDRGDRAAGEALIRRGWIEGEFLLDRERDVSRKYAALLSGAPTAQRVQRLLWQKRASDAARIVGQADPATQAAARARISILADPSKANIIVAGLPKSLRTEPGVLFEQVQAIRRSGDIKKAVPLALTAPATPLAAAATKRWWDERNTLIRQSLQLGLYDEAYRLAAQHGLSDGPEFAEAEFLAGWIALRFISQPDKAFNHFKRLYDGVSYPISKSRGAYWMARAAEEAGKLAEAARYFALAAGYPTTFYGQLAAVRLHQDSATLALPADPASPAGRYGVFRASEVAQAARIASAADDDSLVRQFLLHLSGLPGTAEGYIFAAKLALDLGYPEVAVRIAKKASQDDIVLPSYSYPVVGVDGVKAGAVEPALMLGLSRQESEFNAKAVSPAGARGLMQLMPATAKLVAKQLKVPYDAARLSDPNYNARLGTAYLGGLINSFGGSYTMAIAGYNAGPNRVKQWIAAYGDPRDPKIDPIDWVEQIPFSETRNYVQRVLENTQVYRVRLAKAPVAVRLHADLARPLPPPRPGRDLPEYADTPAGMKAVPVPLADPRTDKADPAPAEAPAPQKDAEAQSEGATSRGAKGGPRGSFKSNGQPETSAIDTSCSRYVLGPDDKPRCIEGAPKS